MIYSSIHHNNTETLVKNVKGVDLYKINEISCIDLSAYDLVGFASGIYQGQFHKNIVHFINQHAKELNHIFLVYTSGKYSLQGTTQGNGLTGGLPPVRFSM